jgi:hypothetical protein
MHRIQPQIHDAVVLKKDFNLGLIKAISEFGVFGSITLKDD